MQSLLKLSVTLLSVILYIPCMHAEAESVGAITLDSFTSQWDGGETITIVSASASATFNPDGTWCNPYSDDVCGVAIMGMADINSMQTPFNYLVKSGSVDSFTARMAAEVINSFPGLTIPLSTLVGTSHVDKVRGVCIGKYVKTHSGESFSRFPGVCSGGNIPPIEAPAKCAINISNNVIDFGNISASKFSEAGAGNVPEGVLPQTRNVTIECSDVNESTHVRVLLKADKMSGNFIQSSNDDIGFLIKDATGSIVPPNNNGQGIDLSTDTSGNVITNINASPVSISGKKPLAGEFSAAAVMVVEND